MNTPPFERTKCACADCTQCCIEQPGPLAPGDFERIAEHLGETHDEARKHFCASPGAVIAITREGKQQLARVGSITPKRVKTKLGRRCVFLSDDNKCKIHSVAPAGCALFDTHMGRDEAMQRGRWLIVQQMQSEQYTELRNKLDYATSYKPKAY